MISPKPQIRVRAFVNEIRRGMSRPELMERYGLNSRELHRAFKKLVDAGAIAISELPEKLSSQYATLVQENIRDLLRYDLEFDVPVYTVDQPEIIGKIRDISLAGLGLKGLRLRAGEEKRFVTLGDDSGAVSPFEFDAVCRWFKRGADEGEYLSGVQITHISPEDLNRLRVLIRLTTAVG